ncbi:transposase [Crocosphaera sp. Alani8]|uniref:transposase n=1 Tax=Crocosphaera sp. Alani8 TaxID=3038952 RepID=UPI00313C3EFA
MPPELAIKARIAQIRGSGTVAQPNTWIGYTHINKNGKKYTYYRLVKAVRISKSNDADNPSKSQVKGKMVKYLGTADSEAYKEMQNAIARRNEIQRLERKLQSLDKEVSVVQSKKRQRKQAALTKLVGELVEKVQTLMAEIAWIKRQFVLQLDTNPEKS